MRWFERSDNFNGMVDTQKRIADLEKRVSKLEEAGGLKEKDVLFEDVIQLIQEHYAVSASLLQRRLSIGYARAARLLDQLESKGLVGPGEGAKPRKVIK